MIHTLKNTWPVAAVVVDEARVPYRYDRDSNSFIVPDKGIFQVLFMNLSNELTCQSTNIRFSDKQMIVDDLQLQLEPGESFYMYKKIEDSLDSGQFVYLHDDPEWEKLENRFEKSIIRWDFNVGYNPDLPPNASRVNQSLIPGKGATRGTIAQTTAPAARYDIEEHSLIRTRFTTHGWLRIKSYEHYRPL